MFPFVPAARPVTEVMDVFALKARGHTDRQISEITDVPINTIRSWRNRRFLRRPLPWTVDDNCCTRCGQATHDFSALPAPTYAYLLGIYLGDGYLGRNGASWAFRVALDTAYPGIIEEVARAISALTGGKRPFVRPRVGYNCVTVESAWRAWVCLFPQHGPGRKHTRSITLADWQARIVEAAPGLFLRGLIHTDGWRGTNRVHAKGRDYQYPRYQFSNRSDDIRRLFTDTCEKLGITWRPWTRYHVSVAQRNAVAILDSHVGPKY